MRPKLSVGCAVGMKPYAMRTTQPTTAIHHALCSLRHITSNFGLDIKSSGDPLTSVLFASEVSDMCG